MVYFDACRSVILAFKHADRTDIAPVMAQWFARSGVELSASADVIVPVQLHWSRMWSYKFNQSAELAWHLAQISQIAYALDIIRRKRRTPSQAGFGSKALVENVRGAFPMSKKAVD
jgi:predicted amidophosphoribosyltransferase